MLLICIFIIIILGIIIVKRPRTIIWMGRHIRNKLLLLLFNICGYVKFLHHSTVFVYQRCIDTIQCH